MEEENKEADTKATKEEKETEVFDSNFIDFNFDFDFGLDW